MKKKLLSLVLAVALCVTSVPMGLLQFDIANAEGNKETKDIQMPEVEEKLSIMLDAGHYGNYNRGANSQYWESKAVWDITEYMAEELETYEGVRIGKTRSDQTKDLAIYSRGKKAKGYDLFVSNHTNSSSSGKTDYPLVIVPYEHKFYDDNPKVKGIAKSIGNNMESIMGTNQNHRIWKKTYEENGRTYNWYGVIRGASAVGTPGIIIEHSFHSNLRICNWLLEQENLKEIAKEEAGIIARTYGAKKKTDEISDFEIEEIDNKTTEIKIYESNKNRKYEIYRGVNGGQYEKIEELSGNGDIVSYIDNEKVGDTKNYYLVRAVSEKTVGEYSEPVDGIRRPSFTVSDEKMGMAKITWKRVRDAEKYLVQRSDSLKGEYKTIYESTSEGSFLDKDFPNGAGKYYKVRACKSNEDGSILYSKDISGKYLLIRNSLSKAISFDAYGYGIGMAKVTWTPNIAEADGYEILRSTSKNDSYNVIARFEGSEKNTSSYIDKNVSKGKGYYYKVRAYHKVAELDNRKYYSKDTSCNGASVLGNIGTTKVNAYGYGVGSAMVKWNKATNTSGYQIFRKTGKNGKYKYIKNITSGKTTSYKDKKVYKGKGYYYKVRPYRKTNAGTYYGKYTTANGATILSRVSRPTIKVARSGKKNIKVSWSKTKGATGYRIYRATKARGKYTRIKTVSASASRYFYDKNKKKGRKYYYKVRAYSTANKTYYSSYSKVKYVKR